MLIHKGSIGAIALAAALSLTLAGALAHDATKYPDWSGQWAKPGRFGNQWDPTKPPGLGQQTPLTPEYQAVLQGSLADQAAGGQGGDTRYTCVSTGMPRMMAPVRPIELLVMPDTTYIMFENNMPRRIYSDGRDFPKDDEPSYAGYSIGKWIDEDGDGRFDVLEVETRNLKGPRTYEASGLPLHNDNESVIRERIYLDKSDKNLLHDEITTFDHALTRPWTVDKTYRRQSKVFWFEAICGENNNHVVIGKDNYFLSADGLLMPARKDQAPPDLRYFKQTRK
jgi:hypothetical protein